MEAIFEGVLRGCRVLRLFVSHEDADDADVLKEKKEEDISRKMSFKASEEPLVLCCRDSRMLRDSWWFVEERSRCWTRLP